MSNGQKVGVGVGVMILHEDRILLGLRHSDSTKADSELHGEGTWTMPGGSWNLTKGWKRLVCERFLRKPGLRFQLIL